MRNRKKEKVKCAFCGSEYEYRVDHLKKGKGTLCRSCTRIAGGVAMRMKYPLKPGKHPELAEQARHEFYKSNLVPQPCRICKDDAEAHHEDYSKPLEVDWLCSKHHIQRHIEL